MDEKCGRLKRSSNLRTHLILVFFVTVLVLDRSAVESSTSTISLSTSTSMSTSMNFALKAIHQLRSPFRFDRMESLACY